MADAQITLADIQALLLGGDGYCKTHGAGLAMACDAMTSASRDLKVVADALQSETGDADEIAMVVRRVAWQLEHLADLSFRVASSERILIDDVSREPLESAGTE
ncbi:MAG TPA: hypothetical protein VGM44_01590 [Polyangiaceae bacterium]|jgi:hypothetical protein